MDASLVGVVRLNRIYIFLNAGAKYVTQFKDGHISQESGRGVRFPAAVVRNPGERDRAEQPEPDWYTVACLPVVERK